MILKPLSSFMEEQDKDTNKRRDDKYTDAMSYLFFVKKELDPIQFIGTETECIFDGFFLQTPEMHQINTLKHTDLITNGTFAVGHKHDWEDHYAMYFNTVEDLIHEIIDDGDYPEISINALGEKMIFGNGSV